MSTTGFPAGISLGSGHRRVPGRGRRAGRRQGRVDLGPILRRPRAPSTAETRARWPATTTTGGRTTWRTCATSASPRTDSPSPGRASFPQGSGKLNRRGLDFYEALVDALLAARHPARAHPVSLGPSAGAPGRGRLDEPGHGLLVRRLRRLHVHAPRGPGEDVDDAQRAAGGRVPRARGGQSTRPG